MGGKGLINSNLIRGVIVLPVGAAIWFAPMPMGLKPQAWHLFAIFVATILGFILQPLPIGALAAIVPGLISIIAVPYFLYKIYPPEVTKAPEAKHIAIKELTAMGPMSFAEKIVALVFLLALVLWATAQFTQLDATAVASLGVSLMLATKVLAWKDVIEEKGAGIR